MASLSSLSKLMNLDLSGCSLSGKLAWRCCSFFLYCCLEAQSVALGPLKSKNTVQMILQPHFLLIDACLFDVRYSPLSLSLFSRYITSSMVYNDQLTEVEPTV